MIRALKVLQNGDHFNVLSDEAKTGVCSGFLLQKYLTRELLEHNPLNFAKDANGNLLVDTERLKHSAIFRKPFTCAILSPPTWQNTRTR